MSARAGSLQAAVLIGGEWLLVALALFAMDALAHLRLEVGQFYAAWAGWAILVLFIRAMRLGAFLPSWFLTIFEFVAPGFLLNEISLWGHGGFTVAQTLYALVLVAALLRVWRTGTTRLDACGGDAVGDAARVLLVGGGAFAVTLPLFTDRLVGGVDARWYACMLGDFLAQLRAGFFPVFLGQGELAWNGGVHPFRSAPVYMHVAGLWDALTLHALDVCAVQHLAAITAAFAGGLGLYMAGVALAPRHRWEVAGVALLYLGAPAALEALYLADAYMTWMALAVLPLVFYGNARVLLVADGHGYVPLAAGLALVWMCHPPIALLATMATLLLQGGGLLCASVTPARLQAAALGAALFLGLSAYYFFSMSELPPQNTDFLRAYALQLGGLALWLAGLVGAGLRRRRRWWLISMAPGAWLMWIGREPWLWWMLATALLVAAVAAVARWRRWFDPAEHAIEVLFPCVIVAAGLAQAWIGPAHPARDVARLSDLTNTAAHAARFFLPLSSLVNQPGDWQPGIGLWLAVVLLALGFFRKYPLAVKLWFTVALLPLFSYVRVPWVSEFLVGFAPDWFTTVAGRTFTLRLMPTMAAFLAVGWVVWFAARPEWERKTRIFLGVVLVTALAWGGNEAAKVVRNGFRATATRTHTENLFRSENVALEHYAYDLLPEPTYYSNGKMDPRLEVRALDESKAIRINPDVTALRMEETGHTELSLVCLPYEPLNPAWLRLGSTLTLAPGEHVLLRFEFDPRKNYSGYLFMISAHGYREYALPESGLRRAFGTTVQASRVISLWNSGLVAERYVFSFRRGGGCTLPSDGSLFAKVIVSHYDAARALVRVDSLLPYRATAAMSWPGFVETSRVWLPGYEATVDGHPVPVLESPERLGMVPVAAGQHTIEVRYVGTKALRVTWWVSALSWVGLLGTWIWRKKNKH